MDTEVLLNMYTHDYTLSVQWSDMDAYQHVNNRHYLMWLEACRIDLAYKYLPTDCTFIVANVTIDYLRAVTFPDTVCAKSFVSRLGNSSMTLHTDIFSSSLEKKVSSADVVIVNYDYNNLCSTAWSPTERTALNKLMYS